MNLVTLRDAKQQVETLLMDAQRRHYPSAYSGMTCSIGLWYGGDLKKARSVGIRVTSVDFSVGMMCGSSWMDSDAEGLAICACVERCLIARTVDYMDNSSLVQGEIADADWMLLYHAYGEGRRSVATTPTVGVSVTGTPTADRIKEARGLVVDLCHMSTSEEQKVRTERLLYLMDRFNEDLHQQERKNCWALAVGNAFDGLSFYGPFPDNSSAVDYAQNIVDADWRAVPLSRPEKA